MRLIEAINDANSALSKKFLNKRIDVSESHNDFKDIIDEKLGGLGLYYHIWSISLKKNKTITLFKLDVSLKEDKRYLYKRIGKVENIIIKPTLQNINIEENTIEDMVKMIEINNIKNHIKKINEDISIQEKALKQRNEDLEEYKYRLEKLYEG